MESSTVAQRRIEWLDIAKAIGIFLVFYGHFVERVYDMGNEVALAQQKLIYAFHMPLFVLLSGFVAKTALPPLRPFLRKQVVSRLLPVLFFSALMMPVEPAWNALFGPSHRGPTQFRGRYVEDWTELCRRLSPPPRGEQSPPRRKLWEQLPAPVQEIAAAGAAGSELDPAAKENLVAALNAALAQPGLFAAEDFAGSDLTPAEREQLQQGLSQLSEEEVRRFNLRLAWQALYPERRPWHRERSYWERWRRQAWMSLRGYTEFNVPIWFLICLFTVELIHFVAVRLLTSALRIGLAIPFFFGLGWFATAGMELRGDIWYFRESLLLYAFYLLGFLLRQTGVLERGWTRWSWGVLAAASSAVLLLTFDLNPGSKIFKPVVLINLSQHGDPLYFVIAAVAGCLAVISLAHLLPAFRLLCFTGRHTLILMGFNGFFFDYANSALVRTMNIPPSPIPILGWCTLVTFASLAACLPGVWILDRYLPQLVGQPRRQGPFLPRLA